LKPNVLVVDASIIAPAVADGGSDGVRYRQRLRGEQLAAPDLLRVEVLSVLRRQVNLGVLDAAQAGRSIEDLLDMPIAVFPTAALVRRMWELRDNLTAYDACYVALAESLGCPLLTADKRLSQAPGVACSVETI
jgi:predicted nucleic acid-binding protein